MTLSKVLGPAVSASPKNLIEQQIRGPHLQTYWIKNSGWSLAQSVFNKPSRWFECKFRLRTTILVFISAHALPCSLVFLLESRVFSTGLWELWIWMPSGRTCSLHFATVSTSPYWLLPYTFSAQPMITLEFGTSGRGGGEFRNNNFKTGYDMAQRTLMNSREVNNLQLSHDSETVLQPVSDPSTCKSHGPTWSSRKHALR